MENSENICIINSIFDQIGGNAVMMNGYNKDNLIDHCDFTNIGATGVLLVGFEDSVWYPSHWDRPDGTPDGGGGDHKTTMGNTEDKYGPKNENYSRDITISNGYFYNCGVFEKQTAGINMSISRMIKVLHNTLHHFPRAAINISDGTFGGHQIAYNDIFDTVRETSDHGPINTWGRDRFWSLGNGYTAMGYQGELKRPYARHDAIETTKIHNNRISGDKGKYYSFGIDLDDGSTNYDVYENLLLGLSIKLREGFDRTVHNNVIIDDLMEKHTTYALNNDQYYDNIIVYERGFNTFAVNSGETTTYDRMYYYNADGPVRDAYGNVNTSNLDPLFNAPEKNDYTVAAGSPVFTLTQFKNLICRTRRLGVPTVPSRLYTLTASNRAMKPTIPNSGLLIMEETRPHRPIFAI